MKRFDFPALALVGVGTAFLTAAGVAIASRNSAGTMAAINGPYVPGTVISSSTVGARLTDIETEITNSADRSGRGGFLAAVRGIDGTLAAPAFSFTSETGSGLFRNGASDVRMSISGAASTVWTANGIRAANGAVATPSLSFLNDTGSGLYRAGSNDIRMAINGADVQKWLSTGVTITGTASVSGATAATGGITVGGSGTAIGAIKVVTTSWTPGAITVPNCQNTTVSVTNIAFGDSCLVEAPADLAAGSGFMTCRVKSAGTVQIAACGLAANYTPPSGTYTIRTFQATN